MATALKFASMLQISMRMRKIIPTTIHPTNFITKASYSSISTTRTDSPTEGKTKVKDHPILSSPCLVLPQNEAINETYRVQTFLGRCLYDVGNRRFVPTSTGQSNIHPPQQEEEMPLSEDSLCMGSSHGWLAFFNLKNCVIYLMNPLTLQTISLPPLQTLPGFIGPCFRKSYVGSKRTNIAYAFRYDRSYRDASRLTPKRFFYQSLSSIVLSSPPSAGADCRVLMIYDGVYDAIDCNDDGLAFCRIGDKKWTKLIFENNDKCEGLIYSKKDRMFYGKSLYNDPEFIGIYVWDVDDPDSDGIKEKIETSIDLPKVNDLEIILRNECSDFRHYLVESSSGEILLVRRYIADHVADNDVILSCKDDRFSELPCKTVRFDVFKLDPVKKHFEYVPNLDDQALFIGTNHSFSLQASSYPGIKANSIYFTDEENLFRQYTSCYSDDYSFCNNDFGIFSLADNSFYPCYQSHNKIFLPNPIWLQPN